jgi:hypothetical protein
MSATFFIVGISIIRDSLCCLSNFLITLTFDRVTVNVDPPLPEALTPLVTLPPKGLFPPDASPGVCRTTNTPHI